MRRLEIVSHCWNYTRLLHLQLSSLCLHPPRRTHVEITIFHTRDDDRTVAMLDRAAEWDWSPHVRLRPWAIERTSLMRRAIGRNLAARRTTADIVWFADCDMLVFEGAVDQLLDAIEAVPDRRLFFPRRVNATSHANGDAAIAAVDPQGPPRSDVAVLDVPFEYNRAIGGVQIVRGDCARSLGYLPHATRYQRPRETWQRTHEDVLYRRALGEGRGHPLEVSGIGRVRHSLRGRHDENLRL